MRSGIGCLDMRMMERGGGVGGQFMETEEGGEGHVGGTLVEEHDRWRHNQYFIVARLISSAVETW